jgi:hypothetical protein
MRRILSHRRWQALALVLGLTAVLGTGTARAAVECDDGDVCNGLETKKGGDCKSGTPLDCDDKDPCTEDQCDPKDGCFHTPIAGCKPCSVNAECNDDNACTDDGCIDGVCMNKAWPDCPRCSAAGACNDSACAAAAQCTPLPEVCDDCADNDGDGLADYEDPDCCIQETTLDIRRLRLKPTTTPAGSRLRLKANMRMSMGPMHDVTLQITDGSGQLLCRTIPAHSWRKGRAVAFRFRDTGGRHADGLRTARLKVRRDGRLVFRARGKKMPLRFTAGGPARITVRMGQQCASTSGELCPHRNALLFFPPVP